jgi:hypothetical protein
VGTGAHFAPSLHRGEMVGTLCFAHLTDFPGETGFPNVAWSRYLGDADVSTA